MGDYKVTKEVCKDNISGICSQCGGEIVPIETVDNAGSPTYWAGCEKCCRFDNGVSPKVYRIAKRMVTGNHYRCYSHLGEKHDDNEETKKFHEEAQIGGTCNIVAQILYLNDADTELKSDD
jgi:hypothetical protein